MSHIDTLKSFAVVLESFLERAVQLKADRLEVLAGIDRLDDIARFCQDGTEPTAPGLTDRVGSWFAQYSPWIEDRSLRPADQSRIGDMLTAIGKELQSGGDNSPAEEKITAEIDRWQARLTRVSAIEKKPAAGRGRKIVLRKGSESLEEAGVHPSSHDSIGLFAGSLQAMAEIFKELSRDRLHLMSILNDTLKTASLQNNSEALLLSALIIYYLKQNGYMVEPFVKRLREAERQHKRAGANA